MYNDLHTTIHSYREYGLKCIEYNSFWISIFFTGLIGFCFGIGKLNYMPQIILTFIIWLIIYFLLYPAIIVIKKILTGEINIANLNDLH
jgi:hypothetical protein